MRGLALTACGVTLVAVMATGAWLGARASAQDSAQEEYKAHFTVDNRPVDTDLLARQIEQETGLKLYLERRGEERDGGFITRGPEQPDGQPFPILTDITVLTYFRPLTGQEKAAIRALIAAHNPARLVARPPDYAQLVQDRLRAKGLTALVDGDPLSGFTVVLQGPVTSSTRLAVQEAVSQWEMQAPE